MIFYKLDICNVHQNEQIAPEITKPLEFLAYIYDTTYNALFFIL